MKLKLNKHLYILFLLTTTCAFGQASTGSMLKGIFSESHLRKYVYENMVFNDYEKRIKPQLKKTTNILEVINKSIVLDTNEFFYMDFKEIQDTSLIFSQDYRLIEFKTTINHTVIRKANSKIDGEDIILPGFYELVLAEKGIIAINTKTNKLLFLSGYLILDDIKSDFFAEGLTKSAILKYIKLKYFNYEPFDIIIKGTKGRFKSKKNANGVIREYNLTLGKTKTGFTEAFNKN